MPVAWLVFFSFFFNFQYDSFNQYFFSQSSFLIQFLAFSYFLKRICIFQRHFTTTSFRNSNLDTHFKRMGACCDKGKGESLLKGFGG